MKFQKVTSKKSWKSPVLQRLAHDDKRVSVALAENADFAEAVRRQTIKA